MRCDDCGIERWKLHRHHVIPKSLGGTDDDENRLNLCANCHEDRHRPGSGPHATNVLAHTPEAKAKRSASFRRLWQDPEYRARMVESRRRTNADPEVNRRRSETARRTFAQKTEEEKAEHRRRISEGKRGGRWARDHERCRRCGTTEKRHEGKGLCVDCYGRKDPDPEAVGS